MQMTELAILYDVSETDELGIRLTAEEKGVELTYLPFYKTATGFRRNSYIHKTLNRDHTKKLQDAQVILNRSQSKSRRIYATSILEALGKNVINPLSVEQYCQSKIRTLIAFSVNGVNIPETVYVACNSTETSGKGTIDNTETIADLIMQELDTPSVVIKPDAGSHGRGVTLTQDRPNLIASLREVEQGITNPSGVLSQRLISKWFYDLRIIVNKEKGGKPRCHETALARGGFREFRTNTFLGNMVFRAKLPVRVREEAERCAQILGAPHEAWVIALDAMPFIDESQTQGEERLRECFNELEEPFRRVKEVKAAPYKRSDFPRYTREITDAYTEYMKTEAYAEIEGVVNETLEESRDKVYFHEGNACPEFWEQTRVVAGINVALDLLDSATSLIDR